MFQQCRKVTIGGLYHFQCTATGKGYPQWQGINKQPHYPIGSGRALQTAQQHSAEDHIITAAGLCQHLCPGNMEHYTWADTQITGVVADRLCQRGI